MDSDSISEFSLDFGLEWFGDLTFITDKPQSSSDERTLPHYNFELLDDMRTPPPPPSCEAENIDVTTESLESLSAKLMQPIDEDNDVAYMIEEIIEEGNRSVTEAGETETAPCGVISLLSELASTCFKGDRLIPIYKEGQSTPFATKTVVTAIVCGIQESASAKLVPSQPMDNFAFMLDLTYLEAWKDVLCDDLGVWTPMGTHNLFYKRTISSGGSASIQAVKSEVDADVKATRYLYSYPTEKDFKRIVITALTKTENGWVLLSHLFLQYYFLNGTSKVITVPSHGNSAKKSAPYYRTKESTKQKIKSRATSLSPANKCKSKTIFNALVQEKGGILQVKNPSDIPRDRMQISNFHRNSLSNSNNDDAEKIDQISSSSSASE